MCKPSPVPPWSRLVVKNGSNARRRTSRLMPHPSSENRISTLSLPDSRTWMSTMPGLPSGNACATALRNRLEHLPVGAGIAVHRQVRLAIDVERQIVLAQTGPQRHHHLLREVAKVEAALVGVVAIGGDLLERLDQFGGAVEIGNKLR